MTLAERFAVNLIAGRKRAGFSQEELGFVADLHRTQIGILERGERLPRLDSLVKLIGALGLTPDELLAGLIWVPGLYRLGSFEVSDSPAP